MENFLLGFGICFVLMIIIIKKYYVRASRFMAKINGSSIKKTGKDAIYIYSRLMRLDDEKYDMSLRQWFGTIQINSWLFRKKSLENRKKVY